MMGKNQQTTKENFRVCVHSFFKLYDNIVQRFPAAALLQRAIVYWTKRHGLLIHCSLHYTRSRNLEIWQRSLSLAVEMLLKLWLPTLNICKQGRVMNEALLRFVQLLKVLPIASASCERGFSQMNLHHTCIRNRLQVERVSDLMMLSINGPPVAYWNARKCVLSWLKKASMAR